ncbi:Ubiquitin c-terminal hydrolase [Mycena kentingensis (nom. inval.)]|nr:Ubiquitin c-terminal hydrolase [Mycena kentingensis (nom. inval.)]
MDIDVPPAPDATETSLSSSEPIDLVGAPFAVIESDPHVFTSLARTLGIRNVEFAELYDVESYAVDHLNPKGLVFCFLWRKDELVPANFADPVAERVWFANQLSHDACASQALLNIVLNCPDIDIGERLAEFKRETEEMSPVMKGLAISSSPFIRTAHRSFSRPCDLRGALHSAATTTLDAAKAKPKSKPANKRAATKKPKKEAEGDNEDEEAYHFIAYVPAQGKVWELDGLKSGPLEVGELADEDEGKTWMDVVRPALRMKMAKYGGGGDGTNIRFCLLALTEGQYEKQSDRFESLKRERVALERRMPAGWEAQVKPDVLEESKYAFISPTSDPSAFGPTFAPDFSSMRMSRDVAILQLPGAQLIPTWERCVRDAVQAKVLLEDEIKRGKNAHTEHIRRTHDYEPFITEFIGALHKEGLLDALLSVNDPKSNGASNNKKRKKD